MRMDKKLRGKGRKDGKKYLERIQKCRIKKRILNRSKNKENWRLEKNGKK